MVSYKELGLVNTREMFAKAIKGGYAIPAFNFNNMEQMQAIVQACVETSSPVIMQVSSGARKYANPTILRPRVPWSMPRSWVRTFRSCCIWITAILSSFARIASIWVSRR